MEMMALINALGIVNAGAEVILFTDSKYLIWAVEEWPLGSAKAQAKAKNLDLLRKIASLKAYARGIECVWVKGHSGNHFNEECDRMANREMDQWENRFADGYP